MSLGANVRVSAGANVHAREFDGEMVLLHLERGDYFGLDAIGAQAWKRLVEGASPAEITDELVERYDVERSKLLADIVALTDQLVQRGLLVVSAEVAPRRNG